MDVFDRIKKIKAQSILAEKRRRPKSKNYNPYRYYDMERFRDTEAYAEYLVEYYDEYQFRDD